MKLDCLAALFSALSFLMRNRIHFQTKLLKLQSLFSFFQPAQATFTAPVLLLLFLFLASRQTRARSIEKYITTSNRSSTIKSANKLREFFNLRKQKATGNFFYSLKKREFLFPRLIQVSLAFFSFYLLLSEQIHLTRLSLVELFVSLL